jgi:Sulfotransferase family
MNVNKPLESRQERAMLPNFFIIGAAKSGTTALYYYLKQHPQIYMSAVKEPRFFAFEPEDLTFGGPGDMELHRRTIVNMDKYLALFRDVSDELAVGEASPVYLCSPKAARRIRSLVPDARLITILRHPVERAYSHFLHQIRDGVETLTDFSEALDAEEQRARDNWEYRWRYKEIGCYTEQLKKYYDTFDRSQMKIYLYEDFDTHPQGVLHDLYRFLGVDETFTADTSTRYNTSGVPRSKVVHTVLSRLQKATRKTFDGVPQPKDEPAAQTQLLGRVGKFSLIEKARRMGLKLRDSNLAKPQLRPEVRQRLLEYYREDILALQDLIRRDMSHWLTQRPDRAEAGAMVDADR